MVNRELINATVQTYGGVDAYGQQLSNLQSSRAITITFGVLTHNTTDDIRYQNVSHYALTKDNEVSDNDVLIINGKKYKVEFISNHKRLNELFLCEQK